METMSSSLPDFGGYISCGFLMASIFMFLTGHLFIYLVVFVFFRSDNNPVGHYKFDLNLQLLGNPESSKNRKPYKLKKILLKYLVYPPVLGVGVNFRQGFGLFFCDSAQNSKIFVLKFVSM